MVPIARTQCNVTGANEDLRRSWWPQGELDIRFGCQKCGARERRKVSRSRKRLTSTAAIGAGKAQHDGDGVDGEDSRGRPAHARRCVGGLQRDCHGSSSRHAATGLHYGLISRISELSSPVGEIFFGPGGY